MVLGEEPCRITAYDLNDVKSMSHYIQRMIETKPDIINSLASEDALSLKRTRLSYLKQLQTIDHLPLQNCHKALRHIRHKEMLRIAFRALSGKATLEETLRETSDFADICLTHTLSYLHKEYEKKYGQTVDAEGNPQRLHIVALGKLGGRELNFSSDVDLLFAFPEEATLLDSSTDMTVSSFFSLLVKSFIKLISEVTQDGFVFRMDLRLRPHGQSGPIVMSFAALENYYQEQGRDWERYAMMKARLLSPHTQHANRLHMIFQSFVYRRYIDFSVLESLRGLKQLIAREVKLKRLSDDVKRGPGGIREVEFIVQALQLTHGGRNKSIQSVNFLQALKSVYQKKLLTKNDYQDLYDAYVFLRRLENAIQMFDDQQTHNLPKALAAQKALCLTFDISDFDILLGKLNQHRGKVTRCFKTILSESNHSYQDDKKLLEKQLLGLSQGQLGDVPSEDLLLSLGFKDPQAAYQRLLKFTRSKRCQRLSQLSKMRLDKFIPLLLIKCQDRDDVDIVFVRILRLLEGIIQRSAYLALLIENPISLEHLLKLFSLSPWISEQVSEQPFLLEALLDVDSLYHPESEQTLSNGVREDIDACEGMEEKLEVLRQFKLKQQLIIAAASLVNQIEADKVSRHLSSVASIVLGEVFNIALNETNMDWSESPLSEHFSIIAYGKLGSQDLGFQSDLDLVFLHDCESKFESKVIRFAQRILNILSTRMIGGVLYHVDTRLRPSGNAGLLVSDIDAFETYQRENAWTWEHQALVKARCITGALELKARFETLRQDILSKKRDLKTLQDDIIDMRQKIHESDKVFDFKHIKASPGGLIDIEFFIQFLVLKYAHFYPNLSEFTETDKIIDSLGEAEILSSMQVKELKTLYYHKLSILHSLELGESLNEVSVLASLKTGSEAFKPYLDAFQLHW